MGMPTKRTIVTNSIIACTLLVLGFLAFNLNVYASSFSVMAPVTNGGRESNQIGLMLIIDNNDDANNLPEIIQTLTNANAGATFFITGSIAVNNLATMAELGEKFTIGNIGYSNTPLNIADKDLITEEITLGGTLLKNLTKQSPHYFTPPQGLYNKHTLNIAQNLGYQTVLPTDRGVVIDWQKADPSLVASYATYQTQAGNIIALKPTTATRQCLAQIIAEFLSQNYHVTSLSELLA